MIDELMTLLESVQDGEVNKKAYHVKSFDESDDEAKATDSSDHWTQGSAIQHRRAHSGHAEVDS